jgi:hypothetical protein
MPRRKAENPKTEQVHFRLTASEFAVLESIAHLERTTFNEYARSLLVAHLEVIAEHPNVVVDLGNRATYAGTHAEIMRLPTGSRQVGAPPDDRTDSANDAGNSKGNL